jgi:mannose-6-phosphate isomerase-like protein (cupin superfamily)
MKRSLSVFIAGLAVGTALTAALMAGATALASTSPDALQAASQKAEANVKVVLENDRVRVRDVTFPPGVTGMHTHKLPHVGVVIDSGTLVFRYPDGKTETAKLERGGAGFREANVTHEPTNTGKTPVRVIEVELK